MVTANSQYFAGKTVNVPHTEHRVVEDTPEREKNAVTFDSDGKAEVSEQLAEALLVFYPKLIFITKNEPKQKPAKPVAAKAPKA